MKRNALALIWVAAVHAQSVDTVDLSGLRVDSATANIPKSDTLPQLHVQQGVNTLGVFWRSLISPSWGAFAMNRPVLGTVELGVHALEGQVLYSMYGMSGDQAMGAPEYLSAVMILPRLILAPLNTWISWRSVQAESKE